MVARIGLANLEPGLAASLGAALRGRGHLVHSAPSIVMAQQGFRFDVLSLDLVILDISSEDSAARNLLANLLILRMETGLRPMVLCLSRAYRGARFEFDLERKGARVVYTF